MHISDGALSAPVLITGAVISVASVGYGLKKLPWNNMMPVAFLSSAFFVASLIHISVGPSSAHLMLNGLMGVVLGWACMPAIAVALFLQALLLQFGGLTTLGVNICTVGLPALLVGKIFRTVILSKEKPKVLQAFFCGAMAIALTSLLVALALTCSGEEFYASAVSVLVAHLPVMVIEGIITALIYSFIRRVAPELLTFS